uniref:Uncharacterized protein n=1 Tax=Nelumbo nucifera TaxID=4432 RepID=A0A822YDX1_NELNU|nr:TPA_asm: hypothetical protein HUJ06_009611 [Nelumbo nucifera]
MEMEFLTEFPHTHMDRRPRKRPKLAWDVPQMPKVVANYILILLVFYLLVFLDRSGGFLLGASCLIR